MPKGKLIKKVHVPIAGYANLAGAPQIWPANQRLHATLEHEARRRELATIRKVRFLADLNDTVKGANYLPIDRAVALLFNIIKDFLPDLTDPTEFHAAFRKVDVTPNGEYDMAMWHLLSADCPHVWRLLEKHCKLHQEELKQL